MAKSLTDQFIDFVASKPAEEEFDGRDVTSCAAFQFLDHIGAKPWVVAVTGWYDSGRNEHPLPLAIVKAICIATDMGERATFGALHTRLLALRSGKEG